MHRISVCLLVVLTLCGVLCAAPAMAEEPTTGMEVMKLMRDRFDGDDRQVVVTMTLVNKRGSKRVRSIEQISKDDGLDRKSLITFRSPADVEGTRYLMWTYDELGKEDDKWLYMPSLKKVRRISGASNNDFFMGSDFTYDDIDMGRRNLGKDTHTLLGVEKTGDFECWKVESIPVDKSDPVLRRIAYIDRSTLLVVRLEYYEKKGLTRVYDVLELQEQQGIWQVKSSRMNNLADEHQTFMDFGPFTYDQGLKDSAFRVAMLQRGTR